LAIVARQARERLEAKLEAISQARGQSGE